MSPILGIWASQNYPRVTPSYESIASVTLGSSASSVAFSSIPSTYKHLQIRGTFIPNGTDFSGVFRLNSDSSSSNYIAHTLTGNGATAFSDSSVGQSPSSLRIIYTQDSTSSSYPASFIIDILDYQNTNKYKTTRTLAGFESNGTAGQKVVLTSGLWMSTSAVNNVTVYSATGGYGNTLGSSFQANTRISLYGIKG